MNRLASFAGAKSFAVYYGIGREEELSRFDIAIVEPAGQSGSSMRRMQQAGTLVLAYLSVVEVRPSAQEVKIVKSVDFLSVDGKPLVNRVYGNYQADLRSNRWVGMLLHRAGMLIHSGYDGLFLDTIGNIESIDFSCELRDSLLLAAAGFVRQLRSIFPEHIIVQNCGLEKLCLLTAGFLDGVCWENPPFNKKESVKWADSITGRLKDLKEKYGLKILLLLEKNIDTDAGDSRANEESNFKAAVNIAKNRGFLLYNAPYRYVGGVNC